MWHGSPLSEFPVLQFSLEESETHTHTGDLLCAGSSDAEKIAPRPCALVYALGSGGPVDRESVTFRPET